MTVHKTNKRKTLKDECFFMGAQRQMFSTRGQQRLRNCPPVGSIHPSIIHSFINSELEVYESFQTKKKMEKETQILLFFTNHQLVYSEWAGRVPGSSQGIMQRARKCGDFTHLPHVPLETAGGARREPSTVLKSSPNVPDPELHFYSSVCVLMNYAKRGPECTTEILTCKVRGVLVWFGVWVCVCVC